MSVWRYIAVADGSARASKGVISAPSLADARDSLRQAGMRPIRIRPAQVSGLGPRWCRGALAAYLRRRRTAPKAEAFDALATLIRSGVTPLRALRVLAGSHAKTSGIALLARTLADRVADGVPLSRAAGETPGWFDTAECAMLAAGEKAGELDAALTRLAERQARSHDLGSRLAGVMLYPMIVTVVGVGVAVYLSVRTLPQLAGVLSDAGVEVPALTSTVMRLGQGVAGNLPVLVAALVVITIAALFIAFSRTFSLPHRALARTPRVFRRARTAESFLALAELTESGLTLVDAVRIVAPTSTGPLGSALGKAWLGVADSVEQGVAFDAALDDPVWFTDEHRELLAAGSKAGELAATLRRLGERDQRSAHRLIDRAASLLEPAAILLLTVFVGTIVLAAVLPIVKLQEIIG